jgi:Ca2+-binding RTX toxin-like protein
MAATYTDTFLSHFRVVDYFNDSIGADAAGLEGLGPTNRVSSFVSATVFERIGTHERILAIRGTNNLADWPTDLVSILTFGSPKFQLQYTALKDKVIYWISNGVLTPGFTVTGHSLGGFLAAALTADAGPEISHTYVFNTPGFAGFQVPLIPAAFNDWLNNLRPGIPAIDASKITNVTAKGGSSFVSALGIPVGDRVDIAIETERLPSLNPLELWNSHKIEILTDALAVYDLLATVDPSISIIDSTKIVEAASSDNRESLERVVKTLALVFGTTAPAAIENRDQLFEKIFQLKNTLDAPGVAGSYHIVPLSDKTAAQIAGLALSDVAVRYALQKLDPFAVSGKDELFASFNERGQLDLASDDGSSGTLTREWLADRAGLLLAQSFVNTFEDGNTIHRGSGSSHDFVVIQPGLDPQVIRVIGPEGAAPPINTAQIIFGTDQADALRGLDAADHLYGGFGDDSITGGKGNDYLDGGPGADALTGDAGNDHLAGGPGDDTLDGGAGADRLEGGAGFDTYRLHRDEGRDVVIDIDGRGRIDLDGVVLAGGTSQRPGIYVSDDGSTHYAFPGNLASSGTLVIDGKIEVPQFRNGDLGIHLVAGDAPPPPDAGGSRIYEDNVLDVETLNRNDPNEWPRYPWGSPDDDTYTAGPILGAQFLGFGGNDLLIGGGTQRALFLGGAGDDRIENHPITFTADTASIFPHLLAGEGGHDRISGSVDDELIFGDFYRIDLTPDATGAFHGYIDNLYLDVRASVDTASTDMLVRGTYIQPLALTEFANLGFEYTGSPLRALESLTGFSLETLPDDAFDDVIDAGGGGDTVVGGPGSDTISGGPGDDRLYGDNAMGAHVPFHTIRIDAPQFESFVALFGEPGDDIIDGGTGDDEISDSAGTSSVVSGGDGNDNITVQLVSDETPDLVTYAVVDGGDGNDTIYAAASDVDIDAGPGDDDIGAVALGGTLIIDAGPGRDRITGFGVYASVDGGAGADTYRVSGLDVTIRDDDPDTGNIDTLQLRGTPQDFQFSRDGDDLLIGYWINISEEADELVPGTTTIEDWFAGARHQIEQVVFTADRGTEVVWAPNDIQSALDDTGLAWSDFVEPENPAAQPIVLAPLPPAATPPIPPVPPPEPDTPPDPPAPDPVPPPAGPAEPAPEPDTPRPTAPVRVSIVDADFTGSITGTSAADTISVLSNLRVIIDAGDGDDVVTTGSGADQIRLGSGNDIASTGGGDDRIIIDRFEGAKRIDGGPGIDTLTIGKSLASMRVSVDGDRIVIRDANGNTLDTTNMNVFEFSDAVIFSEGNESEDVVARLYETMLVRMHGAPGATFWLDQITVARAPAEATGAFAGEQAITGFAASAEAQVVIAGVVTIPELL